MFVEKVCSLLNDHKVKYALVGGHAVNLYGATRGTIDIDLVIKWKKNALIKVQSLLESLGLVSRLPIQAADVFNFKDEYIKNKNLIAWNFYNPANLNEQVDIIMTFDLADKKVTKVKTKNTSIPLLNKKDLILMKKKAGREQDLIDVAALEKLK